MCRVLPAFLDLPVPRALREFPVPSVRRDPRVKPGLPVRKVLLVPRDRKERSVPSVPRVPLVRKVPRERSDLKVRKAKPVPLVPRDLKANRVLPERCWTLPVSML